MKMLRLSGFSWGVFICLALGSALLDGGQMPWAQAESQPLEATSLEAATKTQGLLKGTDGALISMTGTSKADEAYGFASEVLDRLVKKPEERTPSSQP